MQVIHQLKDAARDFQQMYGQSSGETVDPKLMLKMMKQVSSMVQTVISQNQTLMIRMISHAQEQAMEGKHHSWAAIHDFLGVEPQDLKTKWKDAGTREWALAVADKFRSVEPTDAGYKKVIQYIDKNNLLQLADSTLVTQHAYSELNKLYQAKAPRNKPAALHVILQQHLKEPEKQINFLSVQQMKSHVDAVARIHDAANIHQEWTLSSDAWGGVADSIAREHAPFLGETHRNGGVSWTAERNQHMELLLEKVMDKGLKDPEVQQHLSYHVSSRHVREETSYDMS